MSDSPVACPGRSSGPHRTGMRSGGQVGGASRVAISMVSHPDEQCEPECCPFLRCHRRWLTGVHMPDELE